MGMIGRQVGLAIVTHDVVTTKITNELLLKS